MDSLPLELKKIILTNLDDRSKRWARATSKEWFRIIQYDTFIFYWTDLSTLENIIDRLMQYNHPIGITFLKSRFKGDMEQILQLSRLTHATKLVLEQFFALKNRKQWMRLSTLTNLQQFKQRAQYPPKLLGYYHKLTRLKIKHNSEPLGKVLAGMSELKSLTVEIYGDDNDRPDPLTKLPAPLKLQRLSLRYDNNESQSAPVSLTRFQNLTRLVSEDTVPQYLLPNLEYFHSFAESVSHLDANTKLTYLALAVDNFTEVAPQITALTKLKCLFIDYFDSDASLPFLTALTALERVGLNITYDDPGIQPPIWQFFVATNLTHLTVEHDMAKFTEHVTCLTGLQYLFVVNGQQTYHLSHLTNLTSLKTHDNLDRDETYIRKLTKLRSLVIRQDGDPYDLEQLNIADLTNLEELDLNTEITHPLYESLSTLTNLTKLIIQPPADSSVDLENRFTNLEHLGTLAQNSIGWFINMAKLTNLNTLVLRHIEDSKHVDYLTGLTKLTRVLFGGKITKASILERFKHMKNLYHVDVISTVEEFSL